jgi:AcrR family transcriptional regulator
VNDNSEMTANGSSAAIDLHVNLANQCARERILATASRRFYAEGVRAVGVDDIIADAGVAKASFYKYFPSKDDLIVEFLKRRDADWRAWLKETVESHQSDPAARPLAVFDAIEQRFRNKDFRGCAFINCIFERPDRSHPAHVAADEHKRQVIAYIASLLEPVGVPHPREMAREFMMLIDGAIVTAVREGTPWAAMSAKRIAASLLREAGVLVAIKRTVDLQEDAVVGNETQRP